MEANTFPTFKSLNDYTHQQWHIMLDCFEQLKEHPATKMVIDVFNEEGFYEQLSYHQKILKTVCELGSYPLLLDYVESRYRLYRARNIDPEYFLVEIEQWSRSIRHFLFDPYATEFVSLYDHLRLLHHQYSTFTDTSFTLSNTPVDLLTQALIDADEPKAREIFNGYLDTYPSAIEFIDEVVTPTMIRIGLAWENASISVAKEHIATAIVERIFGTFSRTLHYAQKQEQSLALIITPESQLHKLGSKMLATFLESQGWKVAQMNLDQNSHEVFEAIDSFHPKLIVCSIMLPISIPTIQTFVTHLRTNIPIYEGKIAVGGQAFYRTDPPVLLKNVDFQGSSLSEFSTFIRSLD